MVSHIFFADDSYLFVSASVAEARNVLEILKRFEQASGQSINCSKSSIFFSKNTVGDDRDQICSVLSVPEAEESSTYLGLPSIMGRNKGAILGFLKNKMSNRIQSWDGRILGRGGRDVLIRNVAQSIPNYAMGVFLLPLGMCQDLERMMAKYYWKSSKGAGIPWMSWERMARSKEAGGLGYRSLHGFNLALLGKQGWRLLTRPESLVARVYKARYFKEGDFLSAKLGSNPGFIWRSVFAAQELVRRGARKGIGNGRSVLIYKDPWLPSEDESMVKLGDQSLLGEKVSSLFVIGEKAWDADIVRDLFTVEEARCILGIQLSSREEEDYWYWLKEKSGDYSVKSAFRWLQGQKEGVVNEREGQVWKKLWQMKLPPKIKDFIWRAVWGCISTRVQLISRRVEIPAMCPVCNTEDESIVHCLLNCSNAQECWRIAGLGFGIVSEGFSEWFFDFWARQNERGRGRALTLCWEIWHARNRVLWEGKKTTASQIVSNSIFMFEQWRKAQGRVLFPSQISWQMTEGSEHWTKPEINSFKVNIDAAIFEGEGRYGFGGVVRDHRGNFVSAISGLREGAISPEVAEGVALKEVLSWLKLQDPKQYQVETDCLVLVQAINSPVILRSPFGMVVRECKESLDSWRDIDLHFVKRSANQVAHKIARASRLYADRVFSEHNVPVEFLYCVEADLA